MDVVYTHSTHTRNLVYTYMHTSGYLEHIQMYCRVHMDPLSLLLMWNTVITAFFLALWGQCYTAFEEYSMDVCVPMYLCMTY